MIRACTVGLLALMLGAGALDDRCRTIHTTLDEHPSGLLAPWTRNVQGIAHDDANWFITNTDGLYRIPATIDLGSASGWLRVPIPPELVAQGFDHFGDLSFKPHGADGLLCVPVERRGPGAVLAFFRGSDLRYLGAVPLPGAPEFAPLCAIDPAGNVALPVERGRAELTRYRVDWDAIAQGRPGSASPVGKIRLRLEDGSDLAETSLQGAAFSTSGRVLYLITGYLDDHWCPIWSRAYWNDECAIDPLVGGIHVFDVRDGVGGVCRAAPHCDAVRVEKSRNVERGADFVYAYLGTFLLEEEPEGITVWDLDAEGAPPAPGIGGQVHALMLDNEPFSSWDRVSIRHYRAQEDCSPRGEASE